MNKCTINVFFSEEDEGYIAEIPQLPLCSAFGKTEQEVIVEVLKVKEAMLEVNEESK
jgi:predicted RNase H-like HicB family nuclease